MKAFHYSLKMLCCFNTILGKIWTNPAIGLKMSFKNVTEWLGLSIFYIKKKWVKTT